MQTLELATKLTTFKTQRTLCAVEMLCPQRLPEVIATLFHASFVQHKAIHTPEGLLPVIAKILGNSNASEVLAKVGFLPMKHVFG